MEIELKPRHVDNPNAMKKSNVVVGYDTNKLELHSVAQWKIDVKCRVETLASALKRSFRRRLKGGGKGKRKSDRQNWMG